MHLFYETNKLFILVWNTEYKYLISDCYMWWNELRKRGHLIQQHVPVKQKLLNNNNNNPIELESMYNIHIVKWNLV